MMAGEGGVRTTDVAPAAPGDTADAADAIASPRTFVALGRAGFRRYAAYRQATIAGAFTNTVFGFLRTYVLFAVAAGTGVGLAGGYDRAQLATFVWVGQGLLPTVGLWGGTELADRIRSGDVVGDLLRPVHPVVNYLAADLGRAGHAALTRFVPPVAVGLVFFDSYLPHDWYTVPLFALSTTLAVVISFGGRYLVNATAYWFTDIRGPLIAYLLGAGTLGGLAFPLRFLPDWLAVTLWVATPFPSLFQTPLDVLVERDSGAVRLGLVGAQVAWAVALLAAAALVQRRAEHRLVIHGG